MKQAIAFTLTFIAFWLWIYGYSVASASYGGCEEVQIDATNVWMRCDSVAKAMFAIAFAIMVNGYLREWLIFLSVVAINSVLDELFFDPLTLGWSEMAISVILVGYYSHKITRMIYGTPK